MHTICQTLYSALRIQLQTKAAYSLRPPRTLNKKSSSHLQIEQEVCFGSMGPYIIMSLSRVPSTAYKQPLYARLKSELKVIFYEIMPPFRKHKGKYSLY